MNNFSRKLYVALVVATAGLIGGAAVAGATPPTTAEQVGDLATDGAAELLLIVLAVGAAFAGLAGAVFGTRWVIRGIRNGGRV